jgi:hypothetical protein
VAEDVGRYGELEKEKNQLEVELQTAHNWMAMYEDKYDLTKAVAYSKVPPQYTHTPSLDWQIHGCSAALRYAGSGISRHSEPLVSCGLGPCCRCYKRTSSGATQKSSA